MRITVIAVGRLRPPYQDDVEHYRRLIAGPVSYTHLTLPTTPYV